MRRALSRQLFTPDITIPASAATIILTRTGLRRATITPAGLGSITANSVPLHPCRCLALCTIVRGAATSASASKNVKQARRGLGNKAEEKVKDVDCTLQKKEKNYASGKRSKRTQRVLEEENEEDSTGILADEYGNCEDESAGVWKEEEQGEGMISSILDADDTQVLRRPRRGGRSSLKEGELKEEDGDGENHDRVSGQSSTGDGVIQLPEEESYLLIDRFPDLAVEYDMKTNKKPVDEVLADSASVVSWKCVECDFKWKSGVFVRTCLRTKCPQCEKRRNPCLGSRLVQLWDHSLNDPCIDPKAVTTSSNKSAYWRCPTCSTSFQARIKDMVSEKAKCPSCSLLNLHADFIQDENGLLQEWHPLKNGDLDPSQVKPTDQTKLWWLCMACGHEWEASLAARLNKSRRGKGRVCPVCNGKGKE